MRQRRLRRQLRPRRNRPRRRHRLLRIDREPLAADQDSAFDLYARDVEAETTRLVSAADPGCGACAQRRPRRPVPRQRRQRQTGPSSPPTKSSSARTPTQAKKTSTFVTSVPPPRPSSRSRAPVPPVCRSTRTANHPSAAPPPTAPTSSSRPTTASSQGTPTASQDRLRLVGGERHARRPTAATAKGTSPSREPPPSGDVVFFETVESLVPGDTDASRTSTSGPGERRRWSAPAKAAKGISRCRPPSSAVSRTGPQVVVFTTAEALTSDDGDSSQDVYSRSGTTTTLLSVGPEGGSGEFSATFADASADALEGLLRHLGVAGRRGHRREPGRLPALRRRNHARLRRSGRGQRRLPRRAEGDLGRPVRAPSSRPRSGLPSTTTSTASRTSTAGARAARSSSRSRTRPTW